MQITLDGTKVLDFSSFTDQVASALSGDHVLEKPYFGFDLHSFGDCLHGGFLGAPPYHIVVTNAEPMIEAMGHLGLANYCQKMLEVIRAGGRGLVQEDSRGWYEETEATARQGRGPTLLELLIEVVQGAPASLTLLDRDGTVQVTSSGRHVASVDWSNDCD